MEKDDGGPAFPQGHKDFPLACDQSTAKEIMKAIQLNMGMTLRDWFAGQALSGFLSNGGTIGLTPDNLEEEVEYCWRYADLMLKERAKKRP